MRYCNGPFLQRFVLRTRPTFKNIDPGRPLKLLLSILIKRAHQYTAIAKVSFAFDLPNFVNIQEL